MKLENKIALITGAGSGIGKAIALEMGSAGAHIAVNDITAKAAETTAHQIEDLGREALVIPADVADSGQVENMVQQTLNRFGRIDILVNTGVCTFLKTVALQPLQMKCGSAFSMSISMVPSIALAPLSKT